MRLRRNYLSVIPCKRSAIRLVPYRVNPVIMELVPRFPDCVAIRKIVITFQVTRSESFGYTQDKLREES